MSAYGRPSGVAVRAARDRLQERTGSGAGDMLRDVGVLAAALEAALEAASQSE